MMALFLKVRCVGLGVLLASLVIWIPTVNPVSNSKYHCFLFEEQQLYSYGAKCDFLLLIYSVIPLYCPKNA